MDFLPHGGSTGASTSGNNGSDYTGGASGGVNETNTGGTYQNNTGSPSTETTTNTEASPKQPSTDIEGSTVLTLPVFDKTLETYKIVLSNFSDSQKEYLNTNTTIRNKLYEQYTTNPSFDIDFAKELVEYCRANSSVSWDFLINNRTNFNVNQGEINNHIDGGFDTAAYTDFNAQQAWTNISPIIPISKFVGWNVLAHPSWQSMEYAKEQLRVMGYQISSYYSSGQTFQIYTTQNGVNATELAKGLSYLKYAQRQPYPYKLTMIRKSKSL